MSTITTSLKKVASVAAAASLAVGTLVSAAAPASADPYYRGYGHYGHPPPPRHAPQPHYGHGYAPPQQYHHRRDNTGRKIATGVAIGVGALILGSILANQGGRRR